MQILHKVAVIARFLNLTERRVQQLARDGIIPKPEKGKYDLVRCVQRYVHYLQERAYGSGETVTLNLYPEGDDSGATYWSGDAIITSISYNASFDGIVEASFSFTGTGALTESTVMAT